MLEWASKVDSNGHVFFISGFDGVSKDKELVFWVEKAVTFGACLLLKFLN
jgi:hypothetical protein